jgi:hypothetical protein
LIQDIAGTLEYGNYQDKEHNFKFGKIPMEGLLPCFCKHEKKKDEKEYDNGKKKISFNYMWNNETITYPVCQKYDIKSSKS